MSSLLDRLTRLAPSEEPTASFQFKGDKISFLHKGAMFRYELGSRVYPDMLLSPQSAYTLSTLLTTFPDSEPKFKVSNGYLIVSGSQYSYPIKLGKDTGEYESSEEVVLKPLLTAEHKATVTSGMLTRIATVLLLGDTFGLKVLSEQMLLTCNNSVFMLPTEHDFPEGWCGYYRLDGLKRWATQVDSDSLETELSVGSGTPSLMLRVNEIKLTTVLSPVIVQPIN